MSTVQLAGVLDVSFEDVEQGTGSIVNVVNESSCRLIIFLHFLFSEVRVKSTFMRITVDEPLEFARLAR